MVDVFISNSYFSFEFRIRRAGRDKYTAGYSGQKYLTVLTYHPNKICIYEATEKFERIYLGDKVSSDDEDCKQYEHEINQYLNHFQNILIERSW